MNEIILKICADYLVIPVVLAGAMALLLVPKNQRYKDWCWAIITGLVALVFAKVASLLYQSGQRPFEAMGLQPGAAFLPNPGFPSDHVLLVTTITCVVWATTKNKTLTIILAVCCIIIAVARVIALVHTSQDVIAGAICAILAAMVVYGKNFFTIKP